MAMTQGSDASSLGAICYITASSAGVEWQSSGVIVGPHTVLTAAHALWDTALDRPMSDIRVYPNYAPGAAAIVGPYEAHFNPIGSADRMLTRDVSQQDYAIIDFAADLSRYGQFALGGDAPGGTTHLSGFPASAGGSLVDQVGQVALDATYGVYDYATVSAQPGASGGPLWSDVPGSAGLVPTVHGVVSTTAWATQLTASAIDTIRGWQADDTFLWSAPKATAELTHSAYRFYDTATNDHFYTTDAAEAASIRANLKTFTDESVSWATPDKGAGTSDVFRFYDTATKTHFLTDSVAERDAILKSLPSFTFEGVAFEAYAHPGAEGTFALERFFNTTSKVHTYAADASEIALIRSGAVGQGWVDEGASFIVHHGPGDLLLS